MPSILKKDPSMVPKGRAFKLSWTHLWQDGLLAAAVVAVSLSQLLVPFPLYVLPGAAALLVAFVAITLRRVWLPGSLAATVLLALVEVFVSSDRITPIATAYLIVLATAAARGSRLVVTLSGVGAICGGLFAASFLSFGGGRYAALVNEQTSVTVVVFLAPAVFLVSAWLVGLLLRLRQTNQTEMSRREDAESDAARATDVARLERLRADMARDVHDVVGHALSVVIIQADSGEFIDDVERLHSVLATIASTARSSMQEIRGVLDDTDEQAHTLTGTDTIEDVVTEVLRAGIDVRRTVEGHPTPLPGGTALVLRRVVQEMLTNAVRHGAQNAPVTVWEQWTSKTVSIATENTMARVPAGGGGRGIHGMRTRLAAVRGTVEIEQDENLFRITARIPLASAAAGSHA